MRTGGVSRRAAAAAILAALLASGAGVAVGTPSVAGAVSPKASSAPAQLAYTALTPARIADTRCGATPAPSFCAAEALPASDATLATVPAGGSITVDMPSSVPSNAGAVVLNVAAVDQSGPGFLTVWPAGQARSATANLTFAPSQSGFGVSNLVTVALGTSGSTPAVSVYDGPPNGGGVDVTVDLQGYYAPQTGNAGGFTSESPTRIADSRCGATPAPSFCAGEALPPANNGVVTLGPGATDTLTVAGVGGVPSTGVAAAIMNVAVTDTTTPSFLSAYPGTTRPEVANLNWTTGETLSNKVLVDLGPTGQVTLYNHSGSADVVVDVDGWFSSAAAATDGSLLTPLSPARLADTRCGATPVPSFCAGEALPSANAALRSFSGGQSVAVATGSQDGVPGAATAAVLNVTDVQPASGNFLTVYPAGSTAPVAADVTFVPADPYDVVPNAVYADLGTGGVATVLNGPSGAGAADVVVDLFGYFSPAGTPTANLVPSVTTLLANGTSTSTLTATLLGSGLPLAGLPVSLVGVPSIAGACGSLAPASGVTDAAGQFVTTYTSSTTPGVCTVIASLDGLVPAAVLTQTSTGGGGGGGGPGTGVASLLATVSSLVPGLGGTSTLTSTLSGLSVVSSLPVSLAELPSVAGACGTLAPSSGVTNSAGQLVSTYTASDTVGVCQITATVDGLVTSPVDITQALPPGAGTVSLVPSVLTLLDNGSATSTLTTTLLNGVVPIAGVPVSLQEVPSLPGSCGTLVPPSGVTNAAGQFVSTYTASTALGTCTITSSVDGLLPAAVLTQI